jgi:N-acyl-D-amino-acid deacylase
LKESDTVSLLIKNGMLIDPANHIHRKLNLLLDGGKVAALTSKEPEAEQVIDAAGRVVAPGFIDIHMHEDFVAPDGHLEHDMNKAIFNCMLRMGVTTVLGGECGINRYNPTQYLDIVDRDGAPVNVALLVGHAWLRQAVGHADKYSHVTDEELQQMSALCEKALAAGCFGVSYGIRYVPGIDERELLATAKTCVPEHKLIAAHVRDDAAAIFDAGREFIGVAEMLGLPAQFSHIGSMAAFGQMEAFLQMIETYRKRGVDVLCDCYPYYAFSTAIGSTTYDPGWLERYHCGYDVIQYCEGKYRGKRSTREAFEEERKNYPNHLTVCYVMKEQEVDMALASPLVMVGSDGIMNQGQGHPRAAGTFPRVFREFVRKGKISLEEAIRKMTAMPAERMGLQNKGNLQEGADADVVIFNPETIADKAAFGEPTLAPCGIDYVLIGGEIAARDCQVVNGNLGKALRK